MGSLFNSRSAAVKSSWLLMSCCALLILQHVQAQHNRYIPRWHSLRQLREPRIIRDQAASPSLLHPISVPLISAPILKLPPPPKKFAYATFAPIPTKDDSNEQVNGFIQLVKDNYPLYPPAPYYEPTEPPKTAAPTTQAVTTAPPTYTTVKPQTVKAYVTPRIPYVRPPPPTAKPITTRKSFVFKTIKPTKRPRPVNFIQKVTKATPAPTSSTAAPSVAATASVAPPAPSATEAAAPPSVAPELAPIVDVRVPGGEMMKLGATKAIAPSTVASDVTAPATISTSAPAVVPSASTAPAPIATSAPATKAPVPLAISTFKPRPFYYTRPPFRPHNRYTLLPPTKPAETSEDEKSIIDVRVSLPTTTESAPKAVVVEEELSNPAPFDDYEIDMDLGKISSNPPQENSEPEINEEPESPEPTELPAIPLEELSNNQDPVEIIESEEIVEDIEIIPEVPKLIENIPIEPEIIEDAPFEPAILESIPELPEVIETNPVEQLVEDVPEIEITTNAPEIPEIIPEVPKILDIPEEPVIFEVDGDESVILELSPDDAGFDEDIPFESTILDDFPDDLKIFESIPVDLKVDDPVSDEVNIADNIPEISINIEDTPKNLDEIEPELIEPEIVEEEKLLPVDSIGSFFDPIFSDPANDIRLSLEETETTESPEAGLDISSISEDISNIDPVVAEVPKFIGDVSETELSAQESPKILKVPEALPILEEVVEDIAPITEVVEAELLLKKVEPQPFKRSHKYEPVWNIHTFGHGNKNSPPRSQSYPGWPEVSSTTRKSLDYPSWLRSTTLSPNARIVQDITTSRGYDFSEWSPQLKNGKDSPVDNLKSEKTQNSQIKTVESSTKKTTEQTKRLNKIKGLRKSRRRPVVNRRRPSTVKPTTRRGTLPDTLTNLKSTTVKPPTRSTLFPTWEEIQTRKASRERTSSESKESNSGFDTGFDTGFGTGFGDWGSKI